jgi:endonuclease/exonuclease/phosphatase (EEP) superfamily protein YafD
MDMIGCSTVGFNMKEFLSAKVSFDGLLLCLGALVCIFTATAFLGGIGWPCEITSHFRNQYAACLVVLAATFCLRRKFKAVGIFVGFAAANLIVVAHCLSGAKSSLETAGHNLRVMLINVRTENERYDLVIACINKYRPDLLVVEEVDERWLNELARLREDYPHAKHQAREDNFGIALFSRLPMNGAEIVYLGDAEVPSVTAQLEVGDRRMTVVGTHPLPPGSPGNFRLRNEQLEAVAKFVRSQTNPVVVIGDLNATPWSYYFRRFVKESGLEDTSKGKGIHATWPAGLFPLLIPIDHCLASPEIGVAGKTIGGSVGSDHLPVIVDLHLPSGVSRERL